MLKLLVVLPLKQKTVLHFPRIAVWFFLGAPDRWDGIIASSQWSRQSLCQGEKTCRDLPTSIHGPSGCEKKLWKNFGGGGVYLIMYSYDVKYPCFYHDLYQYCIYPDVPMNCDDLAEVKDMPEHHFHQKWLGHFGKDFLQPKRRVFHRFCSRGAGMCIDICIYEYVYI